ncbi:hypothetical protein [Kitasatospora viridis]|uniref:Uncharacterized protein n=1 Tax=Kitasatospora viridis TaxID=281105 RepID=A0A561SFB2_9ACTN|nr:hypothetical protein [Kitasatospora viridis]TWF73508.1 hypothetical protein FHX73_15120 [Kitasatospora viridis]
MPTVSPRRAEHDAAAAEEAEEEDTTLLEGVTSEQVRHAGEESRAEGEPYEDAE